MAPKTVYRTQRYAADDKLFTNMVAWTRAQGEAKDVSSVSTLNTHNGRVKSVWKRMNPGVAFSYKGLAGQLKRPVFMSEFIDGIDVSIGTRTQYIASHAVFVRWINGLDDDKLKEAWRLAQEPGSKQIAIDRGENVLPPDLAKRYLELKKLVGAVDQAEKGSRDHLIGMLYTAMPPRRLMDYQLMKVTTPSGTADKDFNWLVLENDFPASFIFNKFKTQKWIGQQTIDINTKVGKAIVAFLKQNKHKNGDFLFQNTKGGSLSNFSTVVTDSFERLTGNRVNSNLLRRSYITAKDGEDGQRSVNDRRALASDMAHSAAQSLEYNVRKEATPDAPEPASTRAAVCPLCNAAVAPSKRARVAAAGKCAKKAKCID
jgi:hypothetical protein